MPANVSARRLSMHAQPVHRTGLGRRRIAGDDLAEQDPGGVIAAGGEAPPAVSRTAVHEGSVPARKPYAYTEVKTVLIPTTDEMM